MKNKAWLALYLCTALGIANAAGSRGIIQVYSVKTKANPSFMGPTTGELKYQQEVQVLSQKDAFVRVRSVGAPSVEGWIPKSALTTPEKLKLKQGNEVQLSRAGAMAAGKGLNESAVTQGTGQTGAASEQAVDRVEAITPERDGEVEAFMISGGLKRGVR